MRHHLIIAAMAASLTTSSFAQSFTVKGNIPGMRKGTRVALRSAEHGRNVDVHCLSDDEHFEMTGTIESPLLVELHISEKPEAEYREGEYKTTRGTRFMLEATVYQVEAEHIDSLPLNYSPTELLLPKTKHIRVNGGEAQRQYLEWEEATRCQRIEAEATDLDFRLKKYWNNKKAGQDTASLERLEAVAADAGQRLEEANQRFINSHRNYAISLLLQQLATAKPFAYTAEEYDSLKAAFADNYDRQRHAAFAQHIDRMKQYPKGCDLRDLALTSDNGNATRLSKVIEAGKWNFIDFWASWCGPCRAAIPEVKKMHEEYGDRLNIVSLSVDKREADWRKAMADEQMMWRQFLVPQTETKQMKDNYFIEYIPSLIVVSPEGKIMLFTSEAKEAHRYLDTMM
ncbi:MAG: TlpA family protein disulfide reductase [Prevotella sp.]